VIELHTHVSLPGIDDGEQTLGDALEMARAFVAAV
jgi:tyrosine-protein phosphatase YwqE